VPYLVSEDMTQPGQFDSPEFDPTDDEGRGTTSLRCPYPVSIQPQERTVSSPRRAVIERRPSFDRVTSDAHDADVARRVQELHHDLRQPLAAIGALASAGMAQPEVPEVVVTCLERIRTETRVLLDLCRHILDEMQADQEVALDAVATEIAESAARTTTCVIDVDVTPCSIHTNPVAVRRALLNLVDNAMRAAGADGTISIVVRSDARQVRMCVRDSGPGFGAISSGACGIGLSVVEHYARQHNGMVEVGQNPGGGASVSIVLPAQACRTRGASRRRQEPFAAESA
jgi:signal transduction histidine kinase